MVIGSNVLAGASGQGGIYSIDQSIRFNDNDSAYLSKTFAGGSTVTQYTISCWVKLGNYASLLGGNDPLLFEVGGGYEILRFDGTSRANPDAIAFEAINNCVVYTAAKHRDVSSWYHIVAVLDTPNATQTDRIRIYVNGVRQSVSLQSGKSWPTQNQTTARAGGAYSYGVGARNDGAAGTFFDGYIAEYYCLFGQALDPTSFGEVNADTGQWVPTAYTGSYDGTNDFYITGADSADLGADYSGNGNDFTSSGLTSADQVTDTPTNNFATFNPLQYSAITFANGNLDVTCPTATNTHTAMSTFAASSGKWGCQITPTSTFGMVGVCLTTVAANTTPRSSAGAYGVDHGGDVYKNGSFSSNIGDTFTTNDNLELLFDVDAGTLTVKKNGSAFCTITSIPAGDYHFFWADVAGSQASTATGDFGQLSYTPSDAAYKTFCTNNLPDPTIALPSDYFQTVLDTGANIKTTAEALYTDQLEWIKDRANANNHQLIDSVRGTSAVLQSNTTTAETTYSAPSGNSVGWVWKANGTGSSNTDGSITSTVSANTTAGFSIVSYISNDTAGATVGHGLGVAPSMVIQKNRDSTDNWYVLHTSLTGAGYNLYLDLTNGEDSNSAWWNGTAPTSTVVTLGPGNGAGSGPNEPSGENRIMYCFAEVEGFSKFGSYVGNATANNGTFVYLGFRPAFLLIKRTSAGSQWYMYDSVRGAYNENGNYVWANATNGDPADGVDRGIDFLSNGFKLRTGSTYDPNDTGTWIYAAFAESPFKTANAR